jgi:hypothetical protein
MSLAIPDYQDPQDVDGVAMPGAYAWIGDVELNYEDETVRLVVTVHRSPEAAATWPAGARIAPARRLSFYCGAPVPGYPGVVFPGRDTIMGRSVSIASDWMAGASTDEERADVLAAIATGGAIRASLYAYLNELVFTDATEVD